MGGAVRGHARRQGGGRDGSKPSDGGEWDWDALLAAWVEEGLPEERFGTQTPRRYAIVLKAAQRGRLEHTITLAHQVETMARQKMLKPLDDYLKPLRRKPASRVAGDGSAAVAAFLDRKIARQERGG